MKGPVQTSADLTLDRQTFTVEVGPSELTQADRAARRLMDRALVRITNQLGAGTVVQVRVTYEVIRDIPGDAR